MTLAGALRSGGASAALRLERIDVVMVGLIVAWGTLRLWPGLNHDSIWPFDESFHQVVARHTFDTPFAPKLYADPLHDSLDTYWSARIWLVKPPGAFWVAALFMNLVGKVPLAFRLGGFVSQLIAALTVYVLGRSVASRLSALVAALALVSLPAGWTYTQARFIGDELDLELCGCLCVAMLALLRSVQTGSRVWAAVAGAATGAGVLVKLVLAATPLGVAGLLWFLSAIGWMRGLRFSSLVVMVLAAVVVALPWNLYAARTWPELYLAANSDMAVHIVPSVAASKAPQWQRPPDGIINEVNRTLFDPLPTAVPLLLGVWLALRALRTRNAVMVAVALWLWATWLGHSAVPIKISSHLWNVVVPGLIALAVVLHDAWKRLPLALALLSGLATPWVMKRWPELVALREHFPPGSQTRVTDLLPGLVLITGGALLGLLLTFALRRVRPVPQWLGAATAGVLTATTLLVTGAEKQHALAQAAAPHFRTSYTKTVGQALERQTPERSVVLLDRDFDAESHLENHELMFWSNRLVFGGRDGKDYPANGFHPYLVSPNAEPFEPLEVPASAWLRAYDLTKPLPSPAEVPSGLEPLKQTVGLMEVVGYGHERADAEHDRYALVVRPITGVHALRVSFHTESGVEHVEARVEGALRQLSTLRRSAWFVLPAVGPSFERVRSIEFQPL